MSQATGQAPDPNDDRRKVDAPTTPAINLKAVSGEVPPADESPGDEMMQLLLQRVVQLERRVRLQYFGLVILALLGFGAVFHSLLAGEVIVRQKLMESRELTLLDTDGNARLFLRMFSRVPVLQLMDGNGRPRMSLGLRFDDTPFLDLSDSQGRTRATLEMTEDDAPALRLFDENGATTFNIN